MTEKIQAAGDDQAYGNTALDPSSFGTFDPSEHATISPNERALLRTFLVKVAEQPVGETDTSPAAHALRRLRQEAESIYAFIRRNYD